MGSGAAIRCYDRNERTTRVIYQCDVLRDAAHVLEGRGYVFLARRITAQCAGLRPMSDADVEVPTRDVADLMAAIRLIA